MLIDRELDFLFSQNNKVTEFLFFTLMLLHVVAHTFVI